MMRQKISHLNGFVHEHLSRSERLLLILYYYEQLSFQEIAMVMDTPEYRIRQMHQTLTERIKRFMHFQPAADREQHPTFAAGASAVA